MKTNLIRSSALAIALFASGGAYALSINTLHKGYMINFAKAETKSVAEVRTTKANTKVNLAGRKLISADEAINRVEFDFDESDIRITYNADLDALAELAKAKNLALSLGGHADNIGEYVYNWHLSKRRSDAVKAYLISKGVDATKIASTEFGDTQPIAPNTTKDGRQKNRRVEVKLI